MLLASQKDDVSRDTASLSSFLLGAVGTKSRLQPTCDQDKLLTCSLVIFKFLITSQYFHPDLQRATLRLQYVWCRMLQG